MTAAEYVLVERNAALRTVRALSTRYATCTGAMGSPIDF